VILLLDNYDSFAHNLARYLEELGERVNVVRNDATDVEGALGRRPTHIVVSPGPCAPAQSGISVELIRRAGAQLPVLGVCLGHQCIAEAYGARVVRGAPVHGKISSIQHAGRDLFEGLPCPFPATRYHSLVVDATTLGAELEASAWTPDGTLMALRHVSFPAWGVQFHPEAVLTAHGHALLRNFIALGRGNPAPGLAPGLPEPESPQLGPEGAPLASESGDHAAIDR
jgi:anthranilate synthase component 2